MKTPPLKLIPEGGGFQCTATHRNNKATRLHNLHDPVAPLCRLRKVPPSALSNRLPWLLTSTPRRRVIATQTPNAQGLEDLHDGFVPRESGNETGHAHSRLQPHSLVESSVSGLVSPPFQPGLDFTIYMSPSTGSWALSKPLAHSPATPTSTACAREPDRHGELLRWRSTLCQSYERKLRGGVACTRKVGWVRRDRDLTPNPVADQLNMSKAPGLVSLASRLRSQRGRWSRRCCCCCGWWRWWCVD